MKKLKPTAAETAQKFLVARANQLADDVVYYKEEASSYQRLASKLEAEINSIKSTLRIVFDVE